MRLPAYLTENTHFFGEKKWGFWSIALLPDGMLLFLEPCGKNDNSLPTLVLTIMVMACLWEAHVHAMPLHLASRRLLLWNICKRALRTFLSLAVAAIAGSALAGLFLPAYQCYTDRARVTAAIAQTSELRQEIEHRASVAKTLKSTGLGLMLPRLQGKSFSNGFVLENGAIALVIDEPPAALLFTPQLVDVNSGAIQWSCRGYPSKSMPVMCRAPG